MEMSADMLVTVGCGYLPMNFIVLALVKAIKASELQCFAVLFLILYLPFYLFKLNAAHVLKLKLVTENAECGDIESC